MILEKKVNRVLFLDFIRGVAALMVVLSHSFETFYPTITKYDGGDLDMGMAGVLAFFLVSGFVIPFSLERYKSIPIFFSNRIFRIYPLYIAVFVLSVLLYRLNISDNWSILENKIPQNILYHLFFIQDYLPKQKFGVFSLVGGAWTLAIELVWYIIFACIYKLALNEKNEKILLAANVFILVISLTSLFLNLRIPPGRPILLFCCFLGLYLYRYFNGVVMKKNFAIYTSISLLNIYFALYVGFGHFMNPHFSLECVLKSYTLGFAIFLIFYLLKGKTNRFLNPIFEYFGQISYSIYLAHGLILRLVTHYLGIEPKNTLYVIIFSLILATILYNFIEKPGVSLGKAFVAKYLKNNDNKTRFSSTSA